MKAADAKDQLDSGVELDRDRMSNELMNLGVMAALIGGFAMGALGDDDVQNESVAMGVYFLRVLAVHACTCSALIGAFLYQKVNGLHDDDVTTWALQSKRIMLIPLVFFAMGTVVYLSSVVLVSWKQTKNNGGMRMAVLMLGVMCVMFVMTVILYLLRQQSPNYYNQIEEAESKSPAEGAQNMCAQETINDLASKVKMLNKEMVAMKEDLARARLVAKATDEYAESLAKRLREQHSQDDKHDDKVVKDDVDVLAPFGMPEAEVDAIIRQLFTRYDLDGSGTINSFEECSQLLTNLTYAFNEMPNRSQIVQSLTETFDHASELGVDAFVVWYKMEIKALVLDGH